MLYLIFLYIYATVIRIFCVSIKKTIEEYFNYSVEQR